MNTNAKVYVSKILDLYKECESHSDKQDFLDAVGFASGVVLSSQENGSAGVNKNLSKFTKSMVLGANMLYETVIGVFRKSMH